MGSSILYGRYVVLTLALLSLAACHDGKDKAAGQSLVKVNGDEITVHQLNTEVAKTGNNSGFPVKQLLNALVDRQLLVDAAKRDKVDVDPSVMTELERTRDQLLAQAWLDNKIGHIAPPTSQEIDAFYRENPDVFAQRRQYDFDELVIDPKDLTPEIEKIMVGVKALDDVAAFLDQKKIGHGRVQASRTSGDIPVQMVASLKNMERGRLFVVKEGARTLLISLQDAKPAPLSLAAATPVIEQLLLQKKRNDLVKAELEGLRAAAKIEYLPRSEAIMKDAQVAANAAATATAATAATAVTAATNMPTVSAADAAKDTPPDDAHTDRGVAGLK